jgi:nicotinamide riboside transporter PnuC
MALTFLTSKRFETALGTLSLLANVAGSFCVALNLGTVTLGFMLYLVGLVPATYLLLRSNANRTLLLTNVCFFIANIIGLFRHWGT